MKTTQATSSRNRWRQTRVLNGTTHRKVLLTSQVVGKGSARSISLFPGACSVHFWLVRMRNPTLCTIRNGSSTLAERPIPLRWRIGLWLAWRRAIDYGASNGRYKERIPKTMDDSVEQICSMMIMLWGVTNAYPNVSSALYQTKTFAIQSIRTCLILSEIQSDNRKKL